MVKQGSLTTIFWYVFLAIVLLLSGCAHEPTIEYRYHDIPEPPIIERPILDVLEADVSMDAGTIIQLHRSTIIKLKSWGLELETALDAYRKVK